MSAAADSLARLLAATPSLLPLAPALARAATSAPVLVLGPRAAARSTLARALAAARLPAARQLTRRLPAPLFESESSATSPAPSPARCGRSRGEVAAAGGTLLLDRSRASP